MTAAADRSRRRRAPGLVGVAAVFGAAGLLFATSAETARGTQLRTDRSDLASLIRSENAQHRTDLRRIADLRRQVDRAEADEAALDGDLRVLRQRYAAQAPLGGLAPVTGRALVVTLDDAPRGGPRPAGASPDDLVVHQQDVQGVVNALWAGGAEAMTLMDQRVVSTSAVRCVGNTLILQGRVYSPPFTIAAIGPLDGMREAMRQSPTIPIYLEYVQRYRLGWKVEVKDLTMPGFNGSLQLRHAQVLTPASPSGSATSASASSASASSAPPSPAP